MKGSYWSGKCKTIYLLAKLWIQIVCESLFEMNDTVNCELWIYGIISFPLVPPLNVVATISLCLQLRDLE
jgi:hypothetical protein